LEKTTQFNSAFDFEPYLSLEGFLQLFFFEGSPGSPAWSSRHSIYCKKQSFQIFVVLEELSCEHEI
jgi:hypothetical protein